MGQRDAHNSVEQKSALDVQAITSDTTTAGNILDLANVEAIEFLIAAGVLTDGAYAVLIEDGNDSGLSDAAAVADAQLLGTESDAGFAATDDNKVSRIGYIGNKRFVRLSLVSTGTTVGGTLGAVAVLSHFRRTEDIAAATPQA